MKEFEIKTRVDSIKNDIRKCMDKENYEDALMLSEVCANVLYRSNIKYKDDYLEESIKIIGKRIVDIDSKSKEKNGRVFFWDGFGENNRGLVHIYLEALCKNYDVVYATYDDCVIPDILEIIKKYNSTHITIRRKHKSYISRIEQLNELVKKRRPEYFLFYSVPYDIVAIPLLYAYEGILKRFQINLTDHAFWLGAGCFDQCINFRNYGARISIEYRGIPDSKNVIIPFYPYIKEKEFQGYPFKISNSQKIVFSGGALYKTFSEDNKYYYMVDRILSKYSNVVFWYAGSGDDSELKKIEAKYHGRVYHTRERSDLFQVLQKIDIYLSTYPMCGGLMFQYAALAGVVPVSLKHGNISEDFLINQKNINVEFENEELLLDEVDKLLSSKQYYNKRSDEMKMSVIKPDVFEKKINILIREGKSEAIETNNEQHIDTSEFREWCINSFSELDYAKLMLRKDSFRAVVKKYPLKTVKWIMCTIKKRCCDAITER